MTMVKLSNLIAPSFYTVHQAIKAEQYTHYQLGGGRGSAKSSFAAIEIVLGMAKHQDANAVVIRKVGLYLKDSVYEQLSWAIEKLGMSHLWQEKLSPLEMVYLPTGQKILFRGADKPKKLKSTKVSKGYIRYVWYEEADEFDGLEEIRTINQSMLRGGERFEVFYTYNPPQRKNNWVNEWATMPEPGRLVHQSNYLTVPPEWLGETFLVEAEHLKQAKPEAYAHEYLGEVTGTGGEVFRNVKLQPITDDEISTFDKLRRGLDWGYAADPFVYIVGHLDSKRRRLFLFYEFYKVGASFDTAADKIRRENIYGQPVIAESAEPRSNDELRQRGVFVRAAKKGPGSVEHGIRWLQDLEEIIIDPIRCPETAREFTNYELEKDHNGNWKANYPDRDNHSIDAVRYACEDDMRRSTSPVTIGGI